MTLRGIVADNATAFLYSPTSLCTGYMPCALQVRGGSNGCKVSKCPKLRQF